MLGLGLGWNTISAQAPAQGSLDTTFGNAGRVQANLTGNNEAAGGMAIQSDGKIIIAGPFTNLGGAFKKDFMAARFNSNGSLDTTFNGTGSVITSISSVNDNCENMALQPDGKIVVVGGTEIIADGYNGDFAMLRYNTNGSLDTTFNGTGKVITSFGSNHDQAYAVAVTASGKIYVAGLAFFQSFALARYNSDGSLDTAFNSTGKAVTNFGGGSDQARCLAVQPDGKIVLAGRASNGIGVVRYNTDGTLDTSFNGTGKVSTTIGSGNPDEAHEVVVQQDGKIVVAGFARMGGNDDFAVMRLNSNGSFDASFGTLGIVTTPIGSGTHDRARGMTLQLDGKIVASGSSGHDFAWARYNTDGSLDTTVLGTGKVTTAGFGLNASGGAVAIQSDGKIILAGSASDSSGDIGMARYIASTLPSITTTTASNVSSITATLNGTVNPNGTSTTVSFEYGATTSYGSSISATLPPVSGSSALAVSATLSGLTPGATYHYRLVGVNGVGTSNGADVTFTAASTLHVPRNLLTTLPAPATGVQTNAQFGTSVAVDGIYTVVGSPLDDAGATDSGVVKVYNTTTGALLHIIRNPEAAVSDQFGKMVAISGSLVAVGAQADDNGASDAGSVYIYDLSGTAPTLPILTLNNPTPFAGDQFGVGLAISGNKVAVGAHFDDTGSANAGSVYIYDLAGTVPAEPLITINNPEPTVEDRFGFYLALDGSNLLVGAFNDDAGASNAGSAYYYNLASGTPAVPVHVFANPAPNVGDFFGEKVAISGSRLAISARFDDAGATDSGSVYVYDLNSGTPTSPTLSLANPSPASTDLFGSHLALSGTTLVVGSLFDDTGASNTGSAYVFVLLSGTPDTPAHVINNPTVAANDEFGSVLALSGNALIIAAAKDDTGATDAGSAYIYDLTSGTPTVPTATLNSPGPSTDDRFGLATAISGTHTVVGMPREDTGASNAGSVFVYDSASGTPAVPVFTLSNPGPAADDNFGNAVAIQGSRVLVGAPFDDTTAANSGAAYFYDLSSGTPTVPVYTFINPVPGTNDNFGNYVALEGTLLVIGAAEDDTAGVDTGSAYVYDLASTTPTVPIYVINNPSPSGDDSFGSTVGISGRRIVIAAVSDDPGGVANAGSVYAYDLNSGTPTVPVAEITNPLPASGDAFGYHAAISGTRIVVGALADDTLATDAGAAYVYDLTSGTPTVPVFTLPNPTPVAGDNMGHSVAIAGNWVAVGASNDGTAATGSGSVYYYDLAGASPTIPVQTLPNPSPSANDDYGLMMAMDGQRFVIGSPFDDMVAVDKGAAYVFGPSSTPEIAVELLGGSSLTDAASTVNFGYSAVGFSVQKVFRVTNQGGVDLTGLALSVNGSNASDFTLSALGSTTLAPGASTTFTVTFTAGAASSRVGALHITSNAPDESPFDLALTGAGQPGSVDLSYDPQMIGGTVYASTELPNGKIMIGGDFLSVGGQVQANLARLNANGTLDTGFALAVTGNVHAFALQADGKLLIGGTFAITSGGQSRSNLARLNVDGTLDLSMPNLSLNSSVIAILVQADEKIVLGGTFTSVLGQTRNYIARINADGTLDTGFNPNMNLYVNALAAQADGKVLAGGLFDTVGGVTRNRLARINVDGTLDLGFNPNASAEVNTLAVQTDGKIILGGSFTAVGGVTRNHLARVNADGTLDTGFNPNFNSSVYKITLQNDGKVVVGGIFTTVSGGVSRFYLARILTNGGVDSSFNLGCDGAIYTTSVLADSRILIGGHFSKVGGQVRNLVAILGTDGTPDLGTGSDIRGGNLYALSIQRDGKLLIGGTQASVSDLTQPGFTRLLADGKLDTGFTFDKYFTFETGSTFSLFIDTLTYATVPLVDGKLIFNRYIVTMRANEDGSKDSGFTTLTANASPVAALAMQGDGKVIVGGYFTTFGGQPRNMIARINADGTLDTSFNPNANFQVWAIAVQSDGKIVVGGNFTSIGGATRNRIARLNADGTVDAGFDPNANSSINTIVVQPDGKILVGGSQTTIGGISRGRLLRLNSDGTPDNFNPAPNNTVNALSLQTNGQVLVGGAFTSIAGAARNRLVRLQPDGTLDASYVADVDGPVNCITETADGQVLVGGEFSRVNGQARNGLARLANTPAMQSLTANSAGTAVSWVRSGSSPEVDRVTFDSSLDGSTWTSLGNGTRTTNGWQLTGLTLPTGQSYQVRAQGLQMTGGYYGGDSSIYETVALMPANAAPEIVVEQPMSTPLTDAVSTTDFGSVNLGSSMDRTYTIRNTGSADLTGLAVTVDGPHAADFSVLSTPAPAIAATGSTIFTVRFTPSAPGGRYAAIHIHSNDADESPFDLQLIGSGTMVAAGFAGEIQNGSVNAFVRLAGGQLLMGGGFNTVLDLPTPLNMARFQADDYLDMSFGLTSGTASPVNCFARRPDDKIWVGRTGTPQLQLLNADGTVDTSTTSAQPSSNVSAIVALSDGSAVVVGSFTTVGGTTRNRIARISANGALDIAFNPDANGTVNAVLSLADDKLLVGGSFTTIGGTTVNRLARLNSDGSLDATFDPNLNGTVNTLALQTDGKILVGGSFTTVGGVTRNRIARLESNGTLDASYDPNLNGTALVISKLQDGRTVIGGTFTTVGGVTKNRIARLNTDGSLDSSFVANANNQVNALLPRADGKIYVGGWFLTMNGEPRHWAALLNADGTLNSTPLNANSSIVYSSLVQPDGKIVISGIYANTNDQARQSLSRLYADGTLDTAFNPGANNSMTSVARQPDGKLLIAGQFSAVGGVTRNRVARLNEDGSLDIGFNPNANNNVNAMLIQSDGKIVIGGIFTTIGGVTRNRLARLNADGTLDTLFDPNSNGTVLALQSQPDGKILVAGSFGTIGGTTRNRIARLNADGTLDTGFNPNANSTINTILLQPDGKVVIGGFFTALGTVTRNRVARLNADGSLEASFDPSVNGTVYSLAAQADGKILLSGAFTAVGSVTRNNIARLHADGRLDTSFTATANSTVHSLTVLASGQVLVGGTFSNVNGMTEERTALIENNQPAMQSLGINSARTSVTWARSGSSPEVDRVTFESSTDGVSWTSLGSGSRISGAWQLTGLSLPSGQNYLLRALGYQAGAGQYGGNISAYESITSIHASGSGAPEIAVEQPAGAGLISGSAAFDFGAVQVTSASTLTFTVKNTGSAPLSGLAVTFAGAQSADYSVTTVPETPLAALTGTTTFTVRFAPRDSGARSAAMSVWSNDLDENPFTINLTGSGVAVAPSVTTLAATLIQSSSAVLNGSVSDNGANTTISFDYGLTTSYGNNIAASPATLSGGSSSAVSAMIGGLTPSTTYHFRVRAVNSAGTTLGDDATFTTPAFNAGEVDVTFNPLVNGLIRGIALQPDGKVVIGGSFTSVGGVTRNRLARINADGTLDTSFDPNVNSTVNGVIIQEDGKLLIGGVFTSVGGVTRNRIARLNSDGTLDPGFNPNAGNTILSLVLLPDGKVLTGGFFTTMGGVTRNRIARLNADGTLDTSFNPDAGSTVNNLLILANGKILVAGDFTTIGGQTRNRIAQLNADGSLSSDFNLDSNGSIFSMALQPDGKIVMGGNYTTLGGVSRGRIARINADGTLDGSFAPNTVSFSVNSVVLQTDGRILIAGQFSTIGSVTRNRVARLNSDGSLDMSFNPNPADNVDGLALLADGQIIIGGLFATVGGYPISNSARLPNDPASESLRAPFTNRIQWLRGGTSPEAQSVGFELSTNGGSTYTSLGNGTRMAGGWELTGINLPASGQIRARAKTQSGYYNSSIGFVESIQSFPPPSIPEITIFNGISTAPANERTDNTGTFAFANTDTASSSAAQTFTIQNTGTEDLTGLVVSLAAPGDFTFTQPAVTTLAPGATTTFTVTFAPTAFGTHTAALRIASNDFDENPFDIALSGTGVGSLRDNYASRLNLGNAATVDVVGSNRNATIEPGENTFGGITGASVWAQWTAPTTGWVTINTVDSPLDTQIGLYTGGGPLIGSLSLLGFNDESDRDTDLNYFGSPRDVSRLVFMAQAGTTYTISVGGQNRGNQETGTFEFHIAPEPTPPVRVMGVSLTPNALNVTSAVQPATMQLSVDSNTALFADHYLDATIIRPDSGQYGTGQYTYFQDTDRVSGTNTSGVYEQLVDIPRYVPGGAWPVRVWVSSMLSNLSYSWSTQGDDLLEDHYLIPVPATAPLVVTNTGAVDNTAPTLVSVTGFPPVVDVTSGDVTFDVDITFTDGLSGFTSAYLSAHNDFLGSGLDSSSFGSIISGNEFSGVFRQTVTIYQGSQSGTYYPEINLNDAALNQRYYTDLSGYSGERISPPGSDLTFQVIGVGPEIEVEAPGGGSLTDGGPGVDFGSASVAMTAASYDFSGSFTGAFSQYLNEGTGNAFQSGGVLRYHAAAGSGESNAAFIHRDFQPTYNQSWSAEATVSVPLSLDSTLPPGDPWIDSGLTVGFTDTDGRLFHVTVSLSLEPARKYMCFYSVTDTDGSTYEIDTGTDVATTDESGVVRLRFDAATKTLTAETDTNTIFRLDLNLAGWGMTASDTFAIATSFSNSGCSIPESTPITIDDFHAAITVPTAEQTFTITNTGVGNLYGLRLTKDGLNDSDFTLSDLSTTNLMTGQSTTFTVSFAPKGAGTRNATVHLLSNDADESPFDISLTGTGGAMAPTVVTLPATGITRTTATLNGLINNNGTSATVSFDYGPTTGYGSSVAATPSTVSSGTDTAVNAVLTGMTPGTTWHYRVRTTNSVDTTLGEDRSFTVPLEILGEPDQDFNPNAGGGPTSGVLATASQPDGKIIMGGAFTTIGITPRNYIARLNPDGSLDTGFNPNADDTVFSVAVQDDGKILVAGTFFNIGGAPRISCARLNVNGTADLTFDPNIVGDVFSLALQPDGKILIAGWFTHVDGVPRSNIARLHSNGDLDLSFNPAPNSNGIVNAVALQSDGKIIVAGQFTTIGGITRNRIARLLPDGTLDPAFDAAAGATGPTDYIRAISVQADGKLVLGGNFSVINGVIRNRIARLNDNGTLDMTFNPNIVGLSVNSLAMQSDGRLIVVGDFTAVGVTERSRMARLNADGSLDDGFDQSTNAPLFATMLEADGSVIVGGDFTSIGGVTRNRIARLNNESATQTLSATSASRIEWLRGDSAPETQQVSFELSVNGGSTWTPLGTGARIGGGWELTSLTLPSSGRIRGRARVTGGIGNGSAGLVETTYIYSGLPVPEIAVFNGVGTAPLDERADNTGTFNFGPQLLGSNVTRTFTIQSTGTAALSGIGVSLGGTGQFSVTAPGAAILATGATTTFTITFSPTMEGVQSRTVLIASNDSDENPFEIQITGEGQLPPSITTQPVSRLVGLGTTSSLSVSATGSALQYQWLRNGVVVPGATAATFPIPSASLGLVGEWKARVSNGVGTVTSQAVNLGVVDLSTRSVNLTEGDTLNLFVAAGAPGGSYRWMRGGVAIPRGINPETQLTIVGIQSDLAGAYTCQVTMPDPQNPGTPFVLQSGAITVHVGAGAGPAASNPKSQKPVLLPFTPSTWIVGGAVRDVIPALNAPTRFTVRGLPTGVKLNALTGEISGRPTVAIQVPTRYPLTITASNAAGSSAALKADVIVQPLPGYTVGSFHGIIERQTSLNAGHGGRISLTIAATGSLTGKLALGAASSSFTGQLATTQIGQDVTAEIRITRAKPLAALNITFTIQRLTGELTGQVWEQAGTVAVLSAWRQAEDAAAHVDRFEIALTPAGAAVGDATYPQTASTLRLSISRSGVPTWSGRLADSTTITGSSSLGRLMAIPLHHFNATTRSSLQGWLQLTPDSGTLSGSLDWLRLFTQPTAPSFPLHELQAAGVRSGSVP